MAERYEKAQTPTPAVKDISQIVRYLTNTFNMVISSSALDKAARTKTGPNRAYQLQTEFAYLLNEVMLGPRSIMQKNIAVCNEYIDQVIQELNPDE